MQSETTRGHYFAGPFTAGKQNQNKFCQRGKGIEFQILPAECEAIQLFQLMELVRISHRVK